MVNRKLRIIIHVIVGIVGLLGFASVFGVEFLVKLPGDIELPLGGFSSIGINRQGHIYCVSDNYRRVQIYDGSGNFIRACEIPSSDSELYIDSQGNIYVWSDNHKGVYWKYDNNGVKVAEGEDAKPPVSPDYNGKYIEEVIDSNGNTYKIASFSWLFPRVIKQTPSGERTEIVHQPWRL